MSANATTFEDENMHDSGGSDAETHSEVEHSSTGDVSPFISNIESFLRQLVMTDKLSQAALDSTHYTDKKTAFEDINSSLDALQTLSATLPQLARELHQRRAHISPFVNAEHNSAQLIARLPPEIFSLIIKELARIWTPCEEGMHEWRPATLGWMLASHVSASWRRAVISLASLWADEVGTFYSSTSFHTILSRARDAPITLKNSWSEESYDELPEEYWDLLATSSIANLCTVELTLSGDDLARLAGILSTQALPAVETLLLAAHSGDECMGMVFPRMAPAPRLRWLCFHDVYIPFSAAGLVGLSLEAYEYRVETGVNYADFLNTLQSCQSLITLELLGWLPKTIPHGATSKFRIPSLQILNLTTEVQWHRRSLLNLCEHMELPELANLVLNDSSEASSAEVASSLLRWLFSHDLPPPCVRNASRMIARERVISTSPLPNMSQYTVRYDDGSLSGVFSHTLHDTWTPLARLQALPQQNLGVQVNFRMDYEGPDLERDDTFFQDVISSWVESAARLTPAPALKAAYFRSVHKRTDWESVLLPLADVEVLYLPSLSYIFEDGLFTALSLVKPDDALLLPRLTTIICQDASLLARNLDGQEDKGGTRAKAIGHIVEMLRVRAAHNRPVTRMATGLVLGTQAKTRENEEADERLAKLVSLFV